MESKNQSVSELASAIRNIPDFPKPGIQFKDITPILKDPDLYRKSIQLLAAPYRDMDIEYVVGIDAGLCVYVYV